MKRFYFLYLIAAIGFAQKNQNTVYLKTNPLNAIDINKVVREGDKISGFTDFYTNQPVIATRVSHWLNGKAIKDENCDGVIYFKASNGEYYRRYIGDYIDSSWFPLSANNPEVPHSNDGPLLARMFELGKSLSKKVLLRNPGRSYKVDTPIVLGGNNIHIEAEEGVVLDGKNLSDSHIMYIVGSVVTKASVTSALAAGTTAVKVDNIKDFAVGDWIKIFSEDENFDVQRHTENIRKSEVSRISGIDVRNKTLLLDNVIQDNYKPLTTKVAKVTYCENIHLKNITFRGAGTDTKNYTLLQLNQVKNSVIDGCSFTDNGKSGVNVINAYNLTFVNCTTERIDHTTYGDGIVVNGSYFVTIRDCFFTDGRHGVDSGNFDVNRFLLVEGCKITNMLTTGLSQHGGADYTTFSNNQILNCGGGIINRGSNFTAINNTIVGNSTKYPLGGQNYYHGILIGDGLNAEGYKSKSGIGLKLIGNTIDGPSGCAIQILSNLNGALISGNVARGFKWSAIEMANGNNHNNVIISNNIFDCSSQVVDYQNYKGIQKNYGISVYQLNGAQNAALDNFFIKDNIFTGIIAGALYLNNGGNAKKGAVYINGNSFSLRSPGKNTVAVDAQNMPLQVLVVKGNTFTNYSGVSVTSSGTQVVKAENIINNPAKGGYRVE